MLEQLQAETAALGTQTGLNVVAFSGGVDSSLASYLVHSVFEDNSVAAIGCSAALAVEQRAQAQQIADYIGIELWEIPTEEGLVPEYVANEGTACFHCKTTLYSALNAVGAAAVKHCQQVSAPAEIVLFNGTNADDLTDPTRLGLVAAVNHRVASPLAALPKSVVREIAKLAGLPNWDWAAAPCLRSRLDYGVAATSASLQQVGAAEHAVRALLRLPLQDSLRVRVMRDGRSFVEVEQHNLEGALALGSQLSQALRPLGLQDPTVRLFKSGALNSHAQA